MFFLSDTLAFKACLMLGMLGTMMRIDFTTTFGNTADLTFLPDNINGKIRGFLINLKLTEKL